MKTLDQLNDRLAIAIFGKTTDALESFEHIFFVNIHRRYYQSYLKQIIALVDTYYRTTKRPSNEKIKRSKKKRGDEYDLIFEWYTRRIPLAIVLDAIRYCIDYKSKRSEPITTIKYYAGRVSQEWRSQIELFRPSRQWQHFELPSGECVNDKWMYEVWRTYKNKSGYRFDLFYGPYKD